MGSCVLFFFNTIHAQEHFFQHIQVFFPLNVFTRYPQYLTPRPKVKSRSRSKAHVCCRSCEQVLQGTLNNRCPSTVVFPLLLGNSDIGEVCVAYK